MGLLSSYSLPAAALLSQMLEKSRFRVSSTFLSIVPNPSLRQVASSRFSSRAPPPIAALHPHGGGENKSPISTLGSSSRVGEVKRVTKETNVYVKLDLDGSGVAECRTGIPFLDHMLDALLQALGDRKGIHRFGHFSAPLDEAAIEVILV